jgi:hypothetical protein
MEADTPIGAETRAAVKSCRRALPVAPTGGNVAFGFDGFIDRVREMQTETNAGTERIESLEAVGTRILEAADAGASSTFGWRTTGRRAGGHVCHLSRAYDVLGYDPTLVGALGDPVRPFFEETFGHLDHHSVGEPGLTDAVEFDDGKLLISEGGDVSGLDWNRLVEAVGVGTLSDALDGTRLFGIGYWAAVYGLPGIIDGLRECVWPSLADPPAHVIVDPADIRRISPSGVERAADATGRLSAVTDTTLSANRVETQAMVEVLCDAATGDLVEDTRRLFRTLSVDRVVTHGVDRSCCVSADGATTVAVSPVNRPSITTSAGDHFNAGFSLGIIEGASEAAALVAGNAYARRFVDTGETPDYAELFDAVDTYPAQFK